LGKKPLIFWGKKPLILGEIFPFLGEPFFFKRVGKGGKRVGELQGNGERADEYKEGVFTAQKRDVFSLSWGENTHNLFCITRRD